MANLKEARTILDIRTDPLPEDWAARYGMTDARANALMRPSGPDSFFTKNSETALTLFMLGKMDGWSQIPSLEATPRVDSAWDADFFDNVCNSRPLYKSPNGKKNSLWHLIGDKMPGDDRDYRNSVLLIELEIMNSAFHSVRGRPFKTLSFLDLKRMKKTKWSRYDAVLIDPPTKHFVFIEAKLTSDISTSTTQFGDISQIMRNLEAAFHLTSDPESKYLGWTFGYVFLCPRDRFEDQTVFYSQVIRSIDKYVADFCRLVKVKYSELLNKNCVVRLDEFQEDAGKHVAVLHWDELGQVLTGNDFSTEAYFDRLRAFGIDQDKIETIAERLRLAGMKWSLDT